MYKHIIYPYIKYILFFLGNRFAQMQIRLALFSILRHYDVNIGVRKENTLKVANNSFLVTPKDMNLKLTKRTI